MAKRKRCQKCKALVGIKTPCGKQGVWLYKNHKEWDEIHEKWVRCLGSGTVYRLPALETEVRPPD